jgi:hypothetical protein
MPATSASAKTLPRSAVALLALPTAPAGFRSDAIQA